MDITPLDTVNFQSIILETKSIIKANYLHFFTLSQFFLPLAFSLIITPTLFTEFFTFDLFHNLKLTNFHFIYILYIYLLTLCTIGTISNSTYNILTDKPVNHFSSFKSLTFSFFQLLSTTILLLLISLTFLFFVVVIVMLLAKNVGFTIDYYDSFLFTTLAKSVGFTIYFHMNWGLASMVVVVESKWGFEALMRSWYLVKGMRSVSVSVFLYFLIANGSLVVVCSNSMNFNNIFGVYLVMLCLLATTVANALLYFYCKVSHGELEIGQGWYDRNYNVWVDDDKVPRVMEP